MDWVKEKMEHARQQRELLQGQNQTNTDQPRVSNPGGQASAHKKPFNTIWFLGAAATWAVTMIAAWLAGSNVTTYDVSLDSPGNVGVSRTSEVAELKTHIATSMELRNHLDDLNGRIQLLTDSIASVEAGLTRVLVMTDSMPGPASGIPSVALQQQPPVTGEKPVFEMIEPAASATSDTLAIANTAADKPANNIEKPEAGEKAAPDSSKQDSVNTGAGSPWVVNLASLNSKTDADRFAAKARSKDIQVEQYAVVIKGREYWRVQASGFSTAAEARSQANTIKKKLGLKDVWVTKR
jgi:septal ring-binding cell division protein DamX